jgi:hypothetical protein
MAGSLAVRKKNAAKARAKKPSAVERQLQNLFGLTPGLKRGNILPFAVNPKTGKPELGAPQFVYDLARAFAAPGVAASGQPIDAESEATNFAANFTGTGGVASRATRGALGEGRAVLGMSGAPRSSLAGTTRDFSKTKMNPELYGLRKTKDLPRLQASPVKVEPFRVTPKPDKVSLGDYEGRPFIISMADRSAAGDRITGIGNKDLNLPVELQGGQDFMFSPTTGGLVWASEASPVSNIMNLATAPRDDRRETALPAVPHGRRRLRLRHHDRRDHDVLRRRSAR